MGLMSDHIRRELTLIGENENFIEDVVNIGNAFVNLGGGLSGMAAEIIAPMIFELLQLKNLSPLTDNPDEWVHHDIGTTKEPQSMWQNLRNGKAFSDDGGKTYWLLTDGSTSTNIVERHISRPYADVMAARAMENVNDIPDGEIASDYDANPAPVPQDPMDIEVPD